MIRDTRLNRAIALAPRKFYEAAVALRVAAYDTGYLTPRRLAAPVLSIGNITLGGTGKTPLVAMLAAYLRDEGYEVAILTRGYKRKSDQRVVLRSTEGELLPNAASDAGDEPAMLARQLPGVSVIVDADRHAAGEWALSNRPPDVFLLDDGFQHLQLARDANILVVDATDPFGEAEMPPFGRLREPILGMRRASAVVVTRADRAFDDDLVTSVLREVCGEDIPIFYGYHDIVGLRPMAESRVVTPYSLRSQSCAVVCAIGNPEVFVEDLENAGLEVASRSLFRDHHAFTQSDFDDAARSARDAGASCLLTTAKDAIKLESLDHSAMPVYVVEIAFRSEQEALIKSHALKAILRFKP